ncbi:MAG: bifunctional diaminohydroxyphosphoribosylaminopyrimidine deaminase/5-amino-6-(5-phosphoribosylamino)uracil reductase RibD [Chitinophagaceae bacterium]
MSSTKFTHEQLMQRCLQLASLGAGTVSPNPMVGAVLVYEDRIIGEGYHQTYGMPHAEINCINSVSWENKEFISQSTLYVSLEPCAHFGKTPPCTNRIIEEKIPQVVIGSTDPFPKVNGLGIAQLKDAGIEVITGVLKNESDELNKRFFCLHTKKRPYIILKWAQTANEKMALQSGERLMISNPITQRLVHKWRSEEDAVMVGTKTALLDNPILDTRCWPGNNPVRIIPDRELKLPQHLHVFNKQQRTIIFNAMKDEEQEFLMYKRINMHSDHTLQLILEKCAGENIQSILVEGGAKLLNNFIKENRWDEMRVITNENLLANDAIDAPGRQGIHVKSEQIFSDRIDFYRNL